MDQSLLARQKSTPADDRPISSSTVTPACSGGGSEANFLNEWILSDFNLVSYDFNNELSFISGNLFDLSFNYKLVRLITDSCFLMRLRHQPAVTANESTNNTESNNSTEFYILKVEKGI